MSHYIMLIVIISNFEARLIWSADFSDWLHTFFIGNFFIGNNFSSEPGVANEILENEPKSCWAVALFYSWF